MKLIFRFIKALTKYILFGQDVSDDIRKHRLELCMSCEHLKGKRCGECGCFVKPKTRMSTEECVKGKWLAEE